MARRKRVHDQGREVAEKENKLRYSKDNKMGGIGMLHFVRTVFTSLHPAYLIRQYIFSGVVTAVFYIASENTAPASFYVFLGISFVLYPFAMFVYDSIVSLIMGENVWFTSGLFAILWGFFKILLIYFLSVFIAPIGILILYFTHR
ncbi:hypothetical protein [Enterococcus lactis]|uniref:hypothetical protein n=1 Tax=Enterococcus lactis TaxID=357441 RepID=UPI00237B9660|nr:hypothetical protein [Enterococcus lactis]